MFNFLKKICGCDCKHDETPRSRSAVKQAEKEQMQGQSNKQIDKTNEQSFPASDPPANY